MQNTLEQYGWVMGVTYLIIAFTKPYMSDATKKYIPVISILIAWILNVAVASEKDIAVALFEWIVMGLANGKINDMSKKPSSSTTTNEIWYIPTNK